MGTACRSTLTWRFDASLPLLSSRFIADADANGDADGDRLRPRRCYSQPAVVSTVVFAAPSRNNRVVKQGVGVVSGL